MARVHCNDCDLPVVLDPSGRCPDGHYLGATGQRIAGQFGSDTPHPDEPEPWVGQVLVDIHEREDEGPRRKRPARPITAPGAGQTAETHASPDDLLRELTTEDGSEHTPPDSNGSHAADSSPNGHASAANGHHTSPSQPVDPTGTTRFGGDVEQLTAFEAAVQALSPHEDGHGPSGNGHVPVDADGPASVDAGADTTGADGHDHLDDLDDLDALFGSEPSARVDTPPAPPPSTDDRIAALADVASLANEPPPPSQPERREPSAPPPPPPTAVAPAGDASAPPSPESAAGGGLDLGNFTARGRRVGRDAGKDRRRRRR